MHDQRASPPGGNLKVLAADDDPIFRALIASRLAQIAGSIHQAADGIEAWRLVTEHHFHLAVVDLDMPGLDGLALIRCIRSHPRSRHIPIVVCTSRASPTAMMEAIEAGASSYLVKPLNWSMFEAHIGYQLLLSRRFEAASLAVGRLEAALAAKDGLLHQLAGDAATRLGRIGTLARGALNDGSAERASTALQAASTEADVVRDVIDRVETGNRILTDAVLASAAPVGLRGIVDEAVTVARREARLKRVELRAGRTPEVDIVAGADAVGDALRRILRVAVMRAARGGSVDLGFATGDGLAIAVEVAGLTPAGLPSTPAEQTAQSELELAIARAMIEGAGGRFQIAAASQKGWSVNLRLPVEVLAVGAAEKAVSAA